MSNITKKTIIIFGKNGQVASDLINIFTQKSQFDIYNYSSKDIDFTDINNLKEKLNKLPKAHFIINATAYNEVDRAEDEQQKADLINHQAVKEIAKYCQKQQIKFIHYSTNYVFDGKSSQSHKEDCIKNLKPLSIYGQSKLNGENAIINSNCEYIIFRVATVFNLNKENNFVAKIKKLAQNNQELNIVSDQITNPTNSIDIAKSTINVIEQLTENDPRLNNIYHLASNKIISYYEFVKEFLSKENTTINPIATSDFKTKAIRPINGGLDVFKIKKYFNINFDITMS